MPTHGGLPRFTDLTLILTERCNLRCAFCYVPKQRPRVMPRELALRAVDFLVDRAPAGAPLSLSFFGGEPFLARELMAEVIDYAQGRRPEGLRLMTPTNGTLLDDAALALVDRSRMQLATSVDVATGGSSAAAQHTLPADRASRAAIRARTSILRMTVTPANVGELFENVVGLFSEGFKTIMHQPALEQPWPAAARAAWRAAHEKLADWACDRYARRLPLPDLRTLEGIVARLAGRGARYCGAGVSTAAIDPQGRIFGCFRSAYDPQAERLVLGDLQGGPVNELLVAAYAQLHPHRARPADSTSCSACPARDGCTVYCAAMGHVLCGDLRGVPADACALMREQVAACRELVARMRRLARARRRSVSSRVAAAALALGLSSGAAACDGGRAAPSDGAISDGVGAGLCPSPGPELGAVDSIGPGVCPAYVEAGGPGVCDPRPDGMAGLCPPPLPDAMGPGVCPVTVDAAADAQQADLGGPGICAVIPDAAADVHRADLGGPGVCPVMIPDAEPDAPPPPGPGLCPAPGIC